MRFLRCYGLEYDILIQPNLENRPSAGERYRGKYFLTLPGFIPYPWAASF
jgi:hypothetical protein